MVIRWRTSPNIIQDIIAFVVEMQRSILLVAANTATAIATVTVAVTDIAIAIATLSSIIASFAVENDLVAIAATIVSFQVV